MKTHISNFFKKLAEWAKTKFEPAKNKPFPREWEEYGYRFKETYNNGIFTHYVQDDDGYWRIVWRSWNPKYTRWNCKESSINLSEVFP